MNITLYTVGKVKEAFYRNAVAEFQKRLSKYCRLELIEVADEKTNDMDSPGGKDMILKKEGDRILSKIKEDVFVVALAIQGEEMTSVEFSKYMSNLALHGRSNIGFVIGGSLGLSDEVYKRADIQISFSKMTFPHQLMRVITLEQIYRAFRIQYNEPYHK